MKICRVSDLEDSIDGADLLVTTVQLKKTYPIPMVRALGIMLDDVAAKKALDEIVEEIKKIQ